MFKFQDLGELLLLAVPPSCGYLESSF